jgi:hypothetical protein
MDLKQVLSTIGMSKPFGDIEITPFPSIIRQALASVTQPTVRPDEELIRPFD